MVIISAAVTSKTGKALLSRQYSEMSRVRIEGLLSAFPKLMDNNSQHTYVETDTVRYVYLPMEKLYLLLITNKSSNIIEDLDTLQCLSLVVKEKCPTVDEREAVEKAFDLIFAFDEIISMGYRDSLSLDQVNTLLEMDSHEENLQKLIYQNKVEDALVHSKNEENRLKKLKKDNPSGSGSGKMKGISSRDGASQGGPQTQQSSMYDRDSKVGSFKSESGYTRSTSPVLQDVPKKVMGSSLKLGSATKKQSSLLDNLVQQGEVTREEEDDRVVVTEKPTQVQIPTEKVHIKMEEDISAELNRQGGLNSISIEGNMFLTIKDKDSALIRVYLQNENKKGFAPKTHPNIDKNLFAEKAILGLKSSNKPFPTGNPLKVLQWTLSGEKELPLAVTCWPSSGGKGMNVSVEYELIKKNMSLMNVEILLPVPSNEVKVDDIENGTYSVKQNMLTWQLDSIDSHNSSGVLEFSVPNGDEGSFFPIQIKFSSANVISGVSVEDILSIEKEAKVLYSLETIVNGIMTIQ